MPTRISKRTSQRLSVLQYLLYAEARRALLVVLQGIDAGGKDGTIRHVMSGLNPQGVRVTSFKVPEGAEKRHDYLWRVHAAVPEFGQIGIFNRSHYEDVLVVRVHSLVPKSVWKKRYAQINDFERMLTDNGMRIVKFLLYIDKDEQAKRFRERIEDKTKNWKFSPADLKEREYWDQYIAAYEDMLRQCSTKYAPWYVIPANRKVVPQSGGLADPARRVGGHESQVPEARRGPLRDQIRIKIFNPETQRTRDKRREDQSQVFSAFLCDLCVSALSSSPTVDVCRPLRSPPSAPELPPPSAEAARKSAPAKSSPTAPRRSAPTQAGHPPCVQKNPGIADPPLPPR